MRIDKIPPSVQPASLSAQTPSSQSQDHQQPILFSQDAPVIKPNPDEIQKNEPLPLLPIQNENNVIDEKEIVKSPKQSPSRENQKVSARDKQQPQSPVQHIDAGLIIESGHESLMKALRNRYKNIQFIRSMWANGNIKVIYFN